MLYVHHRRSTGFHNATVTTLTYCSVTESLKTTAVTALNAFVWLREELETFDWRDECHVQYSSRAAAEKKAKLLRDMRLQKEEGVERPEDDLVYREFIVGDTSWLKCTISEFLAMETDFDSLTQAMIEAKAGATLAAEKRLKKLAEAYLELFEGAVMIDPLAGYELSEAAAEMQAFGDDVLKRHKNVVAFLRLFASRCSANKPSEVTTDEVTHEVTIQDLGTVLVDGAPLNLIRARKAALFSLAVLGSDVSDEEFALLYNDELYRNPGRAAKYGNIVAQAIKGLKRSLPHIRATKLHSYRTQIGGVTITSELSEENLVEWLHGRSSRGDELLGTLPDDIEQVLLRARSLGR